MAQIRIIGGLYKNRRLQVIDAEGLRPSPERLREALFNTLQWKIQGLDVLDAFAGSGALGLEALSRGAKSCTFIDNNRQVLENIKKSAQLWGIKNANFYLQSALNHQQNYDLILLDPPFASELLSASIIHFAKCLNAGGFIYYENKQEIAVPENLKIIKKYRAGAVQSFLLSNE